MSERAYPARALAVAAQPLLLSTVVVTVTAKFAAPTGVTESAETNNPVSRATTAIAAASHTAR